jgi:hypothetical protein
MPMLLLPEDYRMIDAGADAVSVMRVILNLAHKRAKDII